MQNITAIVLAAGRGTRMKSALPKVLHKLLEEPLLSYPLRALAELGIKKQLVVVSDDQDGDQVENSLSEFFAIDWPRQTQARGTADAVTAALKTLDGVSGTVLILCGDVPLLGSETLQLFYQKHRRNRSQLTVLTAVLDDGGSYGRIILDNEGLPEAIVEAKDATPEQLLVKRINSGTYLVDIDLLRRALAETDYDNAQGEYYLTDMVAFARQNGASTAIFDISDYREILGINSREDLIDLEKIMAARISRYWLSNGVTVRFPETVRIGPQVTLGQDSEISFGVSLSGKTEIGGSCHIGAGAQIKNCKIGDQVEIKHYSVLEDAVVEENSQIGPFARLRPGTEIGAGAKIGNFVETKKARFGKGAKASHLAYIGDAEIGEYSNLGAGTITCNYDGFKKFKTIIGRRVFVGSDSQLVAPLKLGDDVLVGAGSTVTRDVADNALVTTRTRQKELAGRGMAWRRPSSEEQ
ncbi:MAG: bifunctional UDP-N-acetylglucosamine diphosphorylase/glucosamine-1-phosphate N-acetyltransferase GlmU [Deltaproteobacteria bacterium]|nr:bifunctional UDP-N-acetylglucosamine diphosphorylase/glucosamine-1-phosphate N-acetyltransferase GlmU [Deltaproteobacteria bacterium]